MKLKIIVATAAVFGASYLTGVGVATNSLHGVFWALVTALVIGIINITIKPVISVILLPITILTLGLLSFVINGLMVWLAASVIPGFAIPSLLMAIYFAAVLAVINWILHFLD